MSPPPHGPRGRRARRRPRRCRSGWRRPSPRSSTERRAAAAAIDPAFGAAAGELCEFVLGGGKRIRPTFAWWGWRGAGGDPDGPAVAAVLRAVAALELIQACALVHDDLMDASATRRGRPTVHVAFARRHADAALARPARPVRRRRRDPARRPRPGLGGRHAARRRPARRRRRPRRGAVGGDAHRGARRAVPRRVRPVHRRRVGARARCRSTATRPPPTPSSGRCTSARRSPVRSPSWSTLLPPLRRGHRGGVPAARRPARACSATRR